MHKIIKLPHELTPHRPAQARHNGFLYWGRLVLVTWLVLLLAVPLEAATKKKSSSTSSKSRSAKVVSSSKSSTSKKSTASKNSSRSTTKKPAATSSSKTKRQGSDNAGGSRSSTPRAVGLSGWASSARRAMESSGEHWTAYVEDLNTNQVVFEMNPRLRLTPASNRKLVPLALALETMGPDFVFSTKFGLSNKHAMGVPHYHGDLVLKSEGDPSLGFPFDGGPINPKTLFNVWAQQVRQQGISYVHGALVIDGSAFGDDQNGYPEHWRSNHRNQSYAPIPSAISVCQNLLRVQVRPGSGVGRTGRLAFYPADDGVSIVNATRTSSRGSGVVAKFDEGSGDLVVSGPVDDGGGDEVLVPIERPLNYVGALMQSALEDAGVRLIGGVRVVMDDDTDTSHESPLIRMKLAEHQSPELTRLLAIMMRQSNNFLAEQIWRAASVQATGDGDLSATRAFEQSWYKRKGLSWIEPGWDGSGLSNDTKISSQELVAITRVLYDSAWQNLLLETLPESGRNGTLRHRSFDGAAGRVIAKTGTLNNASALTGFVTDRAGRPRFIFSVVGNGPTESNRRLAGRINGLIEELIRKVDESGSLTAEVADTAQGG